MNEPDISVRMAELERIGAANFELLSNQLKLMAKRQDNFNEKIRAYDPKTFKDMEKRHDELTQRLQLLIDKVTVATECCHFVRHNSRISDDLRGRQLAAILFCFDMTEKWWKEGLHLTNGEGLSVKNWTKRCMDAYQNFRLEEATQ